MLAPDCADDVLSCRAAARTAPDAEAAEVSSGVDRASFMLPRVDNVRAYREGGSRACLPLNNKALTFTHWAPFIVVDCSPRRTSLTTLMSTPAMARASTR